MDAPGFYNDPSRAGTVSCMNFPVWRSSSCMFPTRVVPDRADRAVSIRQPRAEDAGARGCGIKSRPRDFFREHRAWYYGLTAVGVACFPQAV